MFARSIAVAVFALAVVASSVTDLNTVVPEVTEELQIPDVAALATSKSDEGCKIDVSSCFAHQDPVPQPTWTQPVDDFNNSFKSMCGPELQVKAAAKETKQKGEANHKELCAKNERNQKYTERKLKLTTRQENYSKAVAEGKEKYLEKKTKNAEENTAKAVGKSQEFSEKAASKANLREDELYKKECASKENAFKAVREGKQKVKIVYVPFAPPPPPPPPTPKPVPTPVPVPKTVVVIKTVPAPTPKPLVQKTVVYVPAPQPVKKVVVQKVSSLKEVLIKTGESTQKSQIKSHELIEKSDVNGREALSKESIGKAERMPSPDEKKKKAAKESSCKEKDAKESSRKREIESKLAVEKVRKEVALKEIASKKSAPVVVKKPCNPITTLEKYVKNCKLHEEAFEKSKVSAENTVKEVKVKAAASLRAQTCALTRSICKKIYSVSHVKAENVKTLIVEHTQKLQEAIKDTDQYEVEMAAKMKYTICESASSDMQYFAQNFLRNTLSHIGVGATVAPQEDKPAVAAPAPTTAPTTAGSKR